MRSIPLAAALALLAALAPPPASAQERCRDAQVRCSTVRVPLEPGRPELGRVPLHVERLPRPAGGRRRGRPVMLLPGGPGQAGTEGFQLLGDPLGAALAPRREIVAFDPRGTGRSGLVRCPELQRDPHLRATRAAEACARRLGDRRGSYGIDEHVADLEAVRAALRIPKLDLVGTSYGSLVALRYAQAFPQRVGRMVLDSVVAPSGTSALGLEIFNAMPRVLSELCGADRCRPFTWNPSGDVAALVASMRRSGPLRGTAYDARGRARATRLGVVGLLDIMLEGDFNPGVREALVPAVVAARRGDSAPLLRLARQVEATMDALPARSFSAGAYAAGSCEVLEQPWDPAADPATRLAQAGAAAAERGDAAFRPFDARTVLDADYLALCLRWPAPLEPLPAAQDALPEVPMLMISGAEDLRTPAEEAAPLVAATPTARHLVVPRVGHSVVASDYSGCTLRAARSFLLRGAVRPSRCRGPRRLGPRVPVAPRTVADLRAPRGVPARIGRTVQAVDLALDDVTAALNIGLRRGGGLRGGSFVASRGGVRLRGYRLVAGVRIDARPGRRGSLVIRTSGSAAARGRLVLTPDARLRGVVGGREIRTRAAAGPPRS